MGQFPAGRISLWLGQPVNAPFITPPLSLRCALILCVLCVTGTLLYTVFEALETMAFGSVSTYERIAIALCFFLLPILIAVSIATNRAISRPLLVLFIGIVVHRCILLVPRWLADEGSQVLAYGIVAVLALTLLIGLYRGERLRFYYAIVSGKAVPDDIRSRGEQLMAAGRLESVFSKFAQTVAPYFEFAAILIVLFAVAAGALLL